MIEEAAGTRMYESKRSSAQKTIEKKDLKLSEIEEVCTCKCDYVSYSSVRFLLMKSLLR